MQTTVNQQLPLMRRRFARIMLTPEVGIIIPIIILAVFTALSNPRFASLANFSSILRYMPFLAVLTVGQAMVIMSGEIDLSVGANAGFSGAVFGIMVVNLGLPPLPAVAVGLLAGGLIGFINGYLVAKFGLIHFVATLSTMFVGRGLHITIAGGRSIYPFPGYYMDFAFRRPLGLSWLFFIMVVVVIVAELAVRYTTIGRKVQSVGGNREAALMAGIDVAKVKWAVYVFSGVMAALCGILWSVDMSAAHYEMGQGQEFRSITAAAVGGVAFGGGEGAILGAILGVLLLQVLTNALQVLKADPNLQSVIVGAMLIAAVLIDLLRKRVESRIV
jgi:ribose transport system permease protein